MIVIAGVQSMTPITIEPPLHISKYVDIPIVTLIYWILVLTIEQIKMGGLL